jgi:heavy metal translocating P-type ATPase
MRILLESVVPALGISTAACVHCGSNFQPQNFERFCCHGCETVFQILNLNGLGRFYELKKASPPDSPLPAQVSPESFSYCDDPEIVSRFAKSENEIEFFIEGLNCSACLWLLNKLPDICNDIAATQVNFARSTVQITKVPEGSFARAARALNRLGYRPHLIDHSQSNTELLRQRERRRELIRIGIAAACTGNIMIFSVSLYGGAKGTLGHQFGWLTALLALPVLTYCAFPFYRSAWASVRARSLNLDVPIVVALIAGIIMSLAGAIGETGTLYFDSLSMLVFLLLSSRSWLKNLQQHHLDTSNLEETVLLRTVERILEDGSLEKISSLSLKADDRISIANDDLLPADGVVILGEGLIHSAILTGESEPVSVKAGDRVFAGTHNLSGRWILKVEKPAMQSRLANILRDADKSSRVKTTLLQFSDRVGQAFVATVFVFAVATVLWFASSDLHEGLSRALALVIVTCPCVFGMAIPLSLSLAIKSAARRGIILKTGDVIERLGKIQTAYFDKTGTLTNGNLAVKALHFISDGGEHLAALAALERGQEHPVAQALLEFMKPLQLETKVASAIRLRERGGIEGVVDGSLYSVVPLGSISTDQKSALLSGYGFFKGVQLLVRFEIEDSVRSGARAAIQKLIQRGIRVRVLSGDRTSVVSDVCTQLDLPFDSAIGNASPEEKHRLLKIGGTESIMIGDGANDAAALGAASVGIAVRGSVDLSLKAADVYLLRPELTLVDELFEIARRTRGAITRNLCFSAGFNLFAGGLAVTGHMDPLWAAVLMPVSSFTVLLSALATGRRLEKQKDKP